MDLSIFLSKVLGIYLIVMSVAFVTQEKRLKPLMLNMMHDSALVLVAGFMALIMGILLVVSHNMWVKDWRVIITIVGWTTLLKGMSIILFPDFLVNLSIKWMQNKIAYYATFFFTFLIGALLIYFGYGKG